MKRLACVLAVYALFVGGIFVFANIDNPDPGGIQQEVDPVYTAGLTNLARLNQTNDFQYRPEVNGTGVLLQGEAPTTIVWGAISGDINNQADLTSWVDQAYYPRSNPTGYITQATWTNLAPPDHHVVGAGGIVTCTVDSAELQIVEITGDAFLYLPSNAVPSGRKFKVVVTGNYTKDYQLSVQQDYDTDADYRMTKLSIGGASEWIFDGTNYYPSSAGTVNERHDLGQNVAFGDEASAWDRGAAYGTGAKAGKSAFAGGRNAEASGNWAVSVGYSSEASGTRSVAVGPASTAGQGYDTALGNQALTRQWGEMRMAADTGGDYYFWSRNFWAADITSQVAVAFQEMWLKGTASGSQRYTLDAKNAIAFEGRCVAIDDTGDESAYYVFDGLISRDTLNNTSMHYLSVTTNYQGDSTWGFVPYADDVNEALCMKFRGYDTAKTNRDITVTITVDSTESTP